MLGSWANSSSSLFWQLESEAPLAPVLVVRRVRRPSNGWIQISRLNSKRSTLAAASLTADKDEAASLRRWLLVPLASRRLRSCCSYWKRNKQMLSRRTQVTNERQTVGVPFCDSHQTERRDSPWPIGKDSRPLSCACKGKRHPICVSVCQSINRKKENCLKFKKKFSS